MSLNFNKINSFALTENRFLYVDVFARNHELIFISPAYGDFKIHYDKISVSCNGFQLNNPQISEYRDSEPVVIIKYEIKMFNHDNIIQTQIKYLDHKINLQLKHVMLKQDCNLVISTLFKDDYKIFKLWYEYYRKNGVDFFYMYYNGILSNEIRDFFQKYQNITLIEWPFHYWNKNQKLKHHAQSLEIHHSIYKYAKVKSKYIIINDLDEYLRVDNCKSLLDFIKSKPDINVFKFTNHWCKTLDQKVSTSLPSKVLVTTTPNKIEYDRSKCIYNTKIIKKIGIHRPQYPNPKELKICNDKRLRMYHFFNWSRPGRKIKDVFKEVSFYDNPQLDLLPQHQNDKPNIPEDIRQMEEGHHITKFFYLTNNNSSELKNDNKIVKVIYKSNKKEEDVSNIFFKNFTNFITDEILIKLQNIEVKKFFKDIDKGVPKELVITLEMGTHIICKEYNNKFINFSK